MTTITQEQGWAMQEALRTIASYYNPAAESDGAQAAARLARETLERLGLDGAHEAVESS